MSHTGKSHVLGGEIAPCEHLVQIYDGDRTFLNVLEGFVASGIRAGEGVIVIATTQHRHMLDDRLAALGLDAVALRKSGQLISLDARETLSKFMNGNWPDETRFEQTISDLLARARTGSSGFPRQVRAFGEMVAILWEQGHNAATVCLEGLWHEICRRNEFPLLCAYPRAGFTRDADDSIAEICAVHSRVVP